MKILTVNITAKDILLAGRSFKKGNAEVDWSKKCPGARAFQRLMKDRNARWYYTYGLSKHRTFRILPQDDTRIWDVIESFESDTPSGPVKFRIREDRA